MRLFQAQSDRWCLWWSVFFSFGIGIYFLCPLSQHNFALSIVATCLVFTVMLRRYYFSWLLLLVTLGFAVINLSTSNNRTRLLSRDLGPVFVSGVITENDITLRGSRLTLGSVSLSPTSSFCKFRHHIDHVNRLFGSDNNIIITIPHKLARAHISDLVPGAQLKIKAMLVPVPGAVLPGGHDLRRQAFFNHTVARAYGLAPPSFVFPPPEKISFDTFIERLRYDITAKLLDNLSPPYGAIASALITGYKGSIPYMLKSQYTDAGLAHILAISGLHLSLVMSIIFIFVRSVLSLIPRFSLHYNNKKIAALFAMLGSGFYLLISGLGLPTQRATIMCGLWLFATMLDRSVLSLRSLSFAALIILAFQPHSLLSVSFQLSFAAVAALLWLYENYGSFLRFLQSRNVFLKPITYGVATLISSIVVTIFTAPIVAFFFHRFNLSGVFTNLIAIPLTSIYIMPLAVVWTAFSFCRLADYPAKLLQYGLDSLSKIAALGAEPSWANYHLSAPDLAAQIVIVLGFIWLIFWRSPLNYWGTLIIAIGVGWGVYNYELPDILINPQKSIVGIYNKESRCLELSRLHCGRILLNQLRTKLNYQSCKQIKLDQPYCLRGYVIKFLSHKVQKKNSQSSVLTGIEIVKQDKSEINFKIDMRPSTFLGQTKGKKIMAKAYNAEPSEPVAIYLRSDRIVVAGRGTLSLPLN